MGVSGLDLEEVAVVDDLADDIADVVALAAIDGDDIAEGFVGLDNLVRIDDGRLFGVVLRQEAQELLRDQDGLLVIVGDEVNVARCAHVGIGTTEFVGRDFFAGHGLDDLGAGDEHVGLAGLDDEVRQCRRVGRTTSARAGDDGDLRYESGEQHVVVEHTAVSREGIDAFLDSGSAGVVDKDEGGAGGRGGLHHGDHFVGLHFAS